MSLEFEATFAARSFQVDLSISSGQTVAVLGPNGAGKSTLVSLIAGLLKPDSGRAVLDGRVLFDLDSRGRGSSVPPHRRRIALLAQQPLLFPHLSVIDNVAFGPRSAGESVTDARLIAERRLVSVGAFDLAERRPHELSGGQAQRVAVARALAPDPSLLMLDEPMAALDVTAAPMLRSLFRSVLADRTTILVTHDALDAYTLADRVVVIGEGRVLEDGATREVLEHPRSAFAAELASLNVVSGVLVDGGLRTADGTVLPVPAAADRFSGRSTAVAFRAVAARAVAPGEAGSIHAVVVDVEPRGGVVRLRVGALSTELAIDTDARHLADLDLTPGAAVGLVIDSDELEAYGLD